MYTVHCKVPYPKISGLKFKKYMSSNSCLSHKSCKWSMQVRVTMDLTALWCWKCYEWSHVRPRRSSRTSSSSSTVPKRLLSWWGNFLLCLCYSSRLGFCLALYAAPFSIPDCIFFRSARMAHMLGCPSVFRLARCLSHSVYVWGKLKVLLFLLLFTLAHFYHYVLLFIRLASSSLTSPNISLFLSECTLL